MGQQKAFIAAVGIICFAVIAWIAHGVTVGGSITGILVTSLLSLAGGPAMFGAVLLVFLLTYAATQIGRSRKTRLSIAEHHSGRDATQVLANLGCAALTAALAQLTPLRTALLAGSIAVLAEAACDTVSSEAGKALAQNPRLITSWKSVPAGTDGAISLPGTLLGIVAAMIIGYEAAATNVLTAHSAVLVVVAGIAGMFLDSILGATLERPEWLSNNAVNLISTAFSAVTAFVFVR
ncbi:MAG TPA: DUF92 domain-containing protein [Terriglobales bacterium]|nr:DUF92 domain-containing protein [Terriglobales bacterium]